MVDSTVDLISRFRAIADCFPDAALLLARDGEILAANRSFLRFGFRWEGLEHRSLRDFVETPRGEIDDYLHACSRSGEPVIGAMHLRKPDGEIVEVRCNGRTVSGDPYADSRLLLIRFTTRRKSNEKFAALDRKIDELTVEIRRRIGVENELKKQRESLEITLASIGDGVIVADAEGRLTFLNPAAELLTGWSLAEAEGQPLDAVFQITGQQTSEPLPDPISQVIATGERVELDSRAVLISRNGQERPIDDSAAPILNDQGRVVGAVLVFRDVSDRRQVEQTLRERNRLLSLRAEVGTLLTTDSPVADVMQQCTSGLMRYLGATLVEVWLKDRETGELRLQAAAGAEHSGAFDPRSPTCGQFDAVSIAEINQPCFAPADGSGLRSIAWAPPNGKYSCAAYPLRSRDQVVGVLGVAVQEPLTELALSELSSLADGVGNYIGSQQAAVEVSRSRQFLQSSLDALTSHVAILDETATIVTVNEAWRRFARDNGFRGDHYGIGSSYLRCCSTVGRQESGGEVADGIRDVIAGVREHFMAEYPCHSPTEQRWFSVNVTRFGEPPSRYLVVAHQNITDRKLAELALHEAARNKDEFLAMLAHELRNPLAPIRTGLDLLRMTGTMQPETVELMQQQVTHLVRLVDDLLDVSRIMRGKVELRRTPTDMVAVVRQAISTIRLSVEEHQHHLTVELPDHPVWLHADPVRLKQIVENLLKNACKYTDAGGRIELAVTIAGDEATLRVKDDGVGMEPEFLPKIFDLFSQSSRALDRSQGGLGIGLTLVRNLVEMHGGTVHAHSEGLNHGSEFRVQLPLSREPGTQSQEAPAGRFPERSMRILAVDDNRAAASLLAALLGKIGPYEIRVAHDGDATLEEVERFAPHLILLDIGLPGMNGYEVARAIRADGRNADLMLVALTGYGQKEDRRRSFSAGFDVHLVKPPALDQLQELFQHPKLNWLHETDSGSPPDQSSPPA